MRLLMASLALLLAAHAAAAPQEWLPSAPAAAEFEPVAPRDPFRSLLGNVSSDPEQGLAGMVLADLKLTGVVRSPQGDIATFENSATGAFFVRPGERMKDGVVVAIDVDHGTVLVRQPDPGFSGTRDVLLALAASP